MQLALRKPIIMSCIPIMPLLMVMVDMADIEEDELDDGMLDVDIDMVLVGVEVDDAIGTPLMPLISTLGLIFAVISREQGEYHVVRSRIGEQSTVRIHNGALAW